MNGKRLFTVMVAVLAVTLGSSLVLAQPSLVAIPKVTNAQTGAVQVGTLPTSITPDGVYVGGTAGLGFGSGGMNTGFVWDAVNGSRHPIAGGYQDSVNGIGYRYPAAGGQELLIGGANAGWQSMNTSTDGGMTWAKNRRTNTHAYAGGSNTVSGSGTGDKSFATFFTPASTTPNLYVDAWNDLGWASAPDLKGTTTESAVNGVSDAGVAVGRRKVSNVYNNYVLTYENDGGLTAVFTAGLDGTNVGSLWDIADNGTYAGGMSPVSDGRPGEFAYIRDMSDGSVIELPNLGGATLGGTNSIVYGMAPNGEWAVGMDHTNGLELAVLWDLRDLNNITVTDLTAFATNAGILGPFTGNLRRGYAIGINGLGEPVITGIGFAESLEASGWTGFVMTVPEPTSLLLLGLGGLALMRRRRS